MPEDLKKLESLAYKPKLVNNGPNKNIMIIEQAEGAVKVVMTLLEQLSSSNTMQEDDKQGCICTLKGWMEHNLRHLKGAFE